MRGQGTVKVLSDCSRGCPTNQQRGADDELRLCRTRYGFDLLNVLTLQNDICKSAFPCNLVHTKTSFGILLVLFRAEAKYCQVNKVELNEQGQICSNPNPQKNKRGICQ